jgi:hypothetical protein
MTERDLSVRLSIGFTIPAVVFLLGASTALERRLSGAPAGT